MLINDSILENSKHISRANTACRCACRVVTDGRTRMNPSGSVVLEIQDFLCRCL